MLQLFSKIIVAYDGSDLSKEALRRAIRLAEQDKEVELDVITVINPSILSVSYIENHTLYDEIFNKIREEAAELIEDAKKELTNLSNQTSASVLEGNPAEMIVEFAQKNDSDLIVIGSRGLSGLKEFFLGSVSHAVVQRAHCPVLIVK